MTDMTDTGHTVDTIEVAPSQKKTGPEDIAMIDPQNETDDETETVMREDIDHEADLLGCARATLTDECGHVHGHGHEQGHALQNPDGTYKTDYLPCHQATIPTPWKTW